MQDHQLLRDRPIDSSPPSVGQLKADLKGKGKASQVDRSKEESIDRVTEMEKLSVVNRIKTSGRILFGETLNNSALTTAVADPKRSGEASRSMVRATHDSELEHGKHRIDRNQPVSRQNLRGTTYSPRVTVEYNAFAEAKNPTEATFANSAPSLSELPISVTQREQLDGLDVAVLLSQPEASVSLVQEEDGRLSSHENSRLRRALFDKSGRRRPDWDDLLNFSPGFLGTLESPEVEARDLTGIADPEEARTAWLQQWNSVLCSYTDEVWGELEPLAGEARQEISQWTENKGSRRSDLAALDRLRMILSHVRGY